MGGGDSIQQIEARGSNTRSGPNGHQRAEQIHLAMLGLNQWINLGTQSVFLVIVLYYAMYLKTYKHA